LHLVFKLNTYQDHTFNWLKIMKCCYKMIKPLLTLVVFTLTLTAHTQTYSIVLKDSEIITVINAVGKPLKINKLYPFMSAWTFDQVFAINGTGLLQNDSLRKYFTKQDIDFVAEQYHGMIQDRWQSKDFGHFRIIDTAEVKEIYKISRDLKKRAKYRDNYFYSLSIPFFSLDRKMAVIKTDYNGGFLCETECITLYKITAEGEWAFITEWNCLSD